MLGVHLLKIPSVPDVHDLGMFQDLSATSPTVSLPDYAKVPTLQALQGYLWGPASSSRMYDTLEHRDAVSIELGALLKLQTPVRLIIARGVEPLVNSAPLSWPSLQRSPASSYEILRCTHAVVVRMLDRQAFLGFIGFEVFAVAVRRITWSSLPRIFAGIAPRRLGMRKHRQAIIACRSHDQHTHIYRY